MKKYNGSLTIEAVISFTIFISFMFLLLSIVKFSLVRITLSTATSETAKQIATAAYPLSYVIEAENSENAKVDTYEGKMQLTEGLSNSQISSTISAVFNTDRRETSDTVNAITKIKDIIGGGDNAENAIAGLVRNEIAKLESKAGAYVICNILNNYLDKSFVMFNKDDVTVSIAKFPQSEFAYKNTIGNSAYKEFGITQNDYTAEDVVVGVEYRYDFALPFLPSFEIKMREVAVEHGWLYGGGNVITNREDGVDFSEFKRLVFGNDIVYLGSMLTGGKYHKKGCTTIYRGSLIMSKSEAEKQGFKPCIHCYGK